MKLTIEHNHQNKIEITITHEEYNYIMKYLLRNLFNMKLTVPNQGDIQTKVQEVRKLP